MLSSEAGAVSPPTVKIGSSTVTVVLLMVVVVPLTVRSPDIDKLVKVPTLVILGCAAVESVPNFAVSKVWIEPGCIVCNACEDIFPEVFEVLADTCIIRPGAPLDDGLKVEEAAEACPVEVIKFTKA